MIWVDHCELGGMFLGQPCRPCVQAQAESIVSFLSDEPKVQQLRQDKAYNLQLLQEQYQIGPSQIDALYNFAKFQFECGNYSGAAEFLYHYRWGHLLLFHLRRLRSFRWRSECSTRQSLHIGLSVQQCRTCPGRTCAGLADVA